MRVFRKEITSEEVTKMMQSCKQSESGEISFQEFIQMIEWLREGRLSVGKKFMRGLSKLKGIGAKFFKGAFSKKKMRHAP